MHHYGEKEVTVQYGLEARNHQCPQPDCLTVRRSMGHDVQGRCLLLGTISVELDHEQGHEGEDPSQEKGRLFRD